jgi:hypothetical protein
MNQRLMAYRRFARAGSTDEVRAFLEELGDRYGVPPRSVENLAQYAGIRLLADQIGVESLDREGTVVVLKFRQDARIDPQALAALVARRADLTLLPPAVLRLDLARPEDAPAPTQPALRRPPPRPGGTPPAGSPDPGVSSSWWTARATSEVEPGFTRDAILAVAPPDPAEPGGLFDRVGRLLGHLSRSMVTG